MAVMHMVWMKFNEGVTEERIAEHMANLMSLKGKVPGILEISTGTNFTERSNGYGHGLVVVLESKEALAVYGPHPEHQAVAQPLAADAALMALDYEFDR